MNLSSFDQLYEVICLEASLILVSTINYSYAINNLFSNILTPRHFYSIYSLFIFKRDTINVKFYFFFITRKSFFTEQKIQKEFVGTHQESRSRPISTASAASSRRCFHRDTEAGK